MQRFYKRKKNLADDKIAKLDLVGFPWNGSFTDTKPRVAAGNQGRDEGDGSRQQTEVPSAAIGEAAESANDKSSTFRRYSTNDSWEAMSDVVMAADGEDDEDGGRSWQLDDNDIVAAKEIEGNDGDRPMLWEEDGYEHAIDDDEQGKSRSP